MYANIPFMQIEVFYSNAHLLVCLGDLSILEHKDYHFLVKASYYSFEQIYYNLINLPAVEGHLGCFQYFAISKSGAMNSLLLYVSVPITKYI